MPTYLNTPQVARMLGVNIQTVRAYIRSGELSAARVGRRYVMTSEDVDSFIKARKGPARRADDIGLTDKGKETVQKVKGNGERVLGYLRDCPGANNQEISEALGLEEKDAQRALLWLEGRHLARCELDKEKPGRQCDPWYAPTE